MKTKEQPIAITGLGMISSIGGDVATSCASARAGIERLREISSINYSDDEIWGNQPVIGHLVSSVAQGFTGVGKLMVLASTALQDLINRSKLLKQDGQRTGFYLNLSDYYFQDEFAKKEIQDDREVKKPNISLPSEIWKSQTKNFIGHLIKSTELGILPINQSIYYDDHTGIIQAVADAIVKIRTGVIDRCIIGGVSSCLEISYLTAAAKQGVLKTAINQIGFIPGEAAAFVLIEKLELALIQKSRVLGIIDSPLISEDKYHRFSETPPTGTALSRVLEGSIAGLKGESKKVGLTIGDLNGDPFRASDFGHSLLRMPSNIEFRDLPLWLPAISFGETGAATGAVSLCMGINAFTRGYANTEAILVWLSSDNGRRASFCLVKYK